MPKVIELEVNSGERNYWAGQALCPASGENFKNIFCPKRNECELPYILLKARSQADALQVAEQAQKDKQLPRCLDNRPYKVRSTIARVAFQPSMRDLAQYL